MFLKIKMFYTALPSVHRGRAQRESPMCSWQPLLSRWVSLVFGLWFCQHTSPETSWGHACTSGPRFPSAWLIRVSACAQQAPETVGLSCRCTGRGWLEKRRHLDHDLGDRLSRPGFHCVTCVGSWLWPSPRQSCSVFFWESSGRRSAYTGLWKVQCAPCTHVFIGFRLTSVPSISTLFSKWIGHSNHLLYFFICVFPTRSTLVFLILFYRSPEITTHFYSVSTVLLYV